MKPKVISQKLLREFLPKFLFFVSCFLSYTNQPAQAEGSRDMVKDGGDRPYTEWASGETANIIRQTLLQVYVEAGETVYFGSSVHTSANGTNDIVYRSPNGGQNGSCNVLSTGFGFIDTVTKETAGPKPLNANGYEPCSFTATETGIYQFEMRAPSLTGNPLPMSVTAAFPTSSTQSSGVAAWDITVVKGGVAQTGRVFTRYLAMNMGLNNYFLNADFYIQTQDGYRYLTDMNGVDPYGFIFFSNNRGFLDTDDSTLYHSVKANNNNLSPFLGGVQVQRPDVADTETNITHYVFFNPPDPKTLIQLNIPTSPILPAQPTNFGFVGGTGNSGNQTKVAVGGNFSFNTTSSGSYQIIIDTNSPDDTTGQFNPDGIFDPSIDTVLENPALVGFNVVDWNGKDNKGNNVPPRPSNQAYDARIILRVGEYHFPMLDAENNLKGLIIKLENPPSPYPLIYDANNQPINEFTVYYDDSNYTTANGTFVDLNGTGASSPRNAALGINSSSGVHGFSNNYGDFKGIDTWTFFPSEPSFATLVITTDKEANVRGTKSVQFHTDTDSNGLVTVGDKVKYTITYSNLGNTTNNSDAIDFIINDTLPSQLTFESANITAQTAGNTITLNSSYNGSGALTQIGALRVNDTITIEIIAEINNNNSGNPILNQANATFKTPDSTSTIGTVYTDADSVDATVDPPSVGNYFVQTADDGENVGNNPADTADDDPTAIVVDTSVVGSPNVLLVKRITSINGTTDIRPNGQNMTIYHNQDPSYPTGDYIFDDNDNANNYVEVDHDDDPNTPKIKIYGTDKWPTPSSFLKGAINGGEIEPDDSVEYTIYFLSAGLTEAKNVLLCDRLPSGTEFELNTYNTGTGILLYHNLENKELTNIGGDDQGEYFPPTVEPSTVYPDIKCGGPNTNGAVVVNLGDLPKAIAPGNPTTSYGYIRFRAKLKN